MSYSSQIPGVTLRERLREQLGRRATGLAVALLLETLLILALFTLSQSKDLPEQEPEIVTAFDAGAEPEAEPEPEPEPEAKPDPAAPSTPQEVQPLPTPPQPTSPPPSPIPLRRDQSRNFDISRLPQAPAPMRPAQPAYGPQGNAGLTGDSRRVGTAPNGEPMYAAQWYRRPDKTMLGHYLSTAQGPGWGMITCRTVPEWRVEDCVAIGEHPEHSNISRAVLAAAWEFRVRPPRLRGRNMYGEWVRIRISYDIEQDRFEYDDY